MTILNFTVGPVMSNANILKIGGEQVPYFRNMDFSKLMLENEKLIKEFAGTTKYGRAAFMTCSGTGSMEASVINMFTPKDKVLIINGGSFGQRFVDICNIHNIPYTEIIPKFGYDITDEDLLKFKGKGYTGFLVNRNETSVGVLYNIQRISNFCKENNISLIVDSISSFLCDPLNMEELNVDILITGSQKALACPPGISIIILSEKAVNKIQKNNVQSLYFDLKDALKNGERGQTPFTPAVNILRQINFRLNEIKKAGGDAEEIKRIHIIATDFREKISNLPLKIVSHSLPNAVTSLSPQKSNAYEIFLELQNNYNIWICPNGGNLKNKVFRVGHIGDISINDNDTLINALKDLNKKGIL